MIIFVYSTFEMLFPYNNKGGEPFNPPPSMIDVSITLRRRSRMLRED